MKNNKTKNYLYDIFDTIVSRKVQPEYVKKMWATNMVKIFNLEISAIDLYKLRFDIEADLGKKALENGFDAEIIYDDIIKEIHGKLNTNIPYKDFLSKSKAEEIEIEANVLYTNEDVIKQIKEQRKNKGNIYCVSDMYLSKEMILSIFEKLGIANLFNDIFAFVNCFCIKIKNNNIILMFLSYTIIAAFIA